jgi:ribosomal protein S27AE
MKTPDMIHEITHKGTRMSNDEEQGMSKYGVDEDQAIKEKKASRGCPHCGTPADKLARHGSIIMCPYCGTEPFEGGA